MRTRVVLSILAGVAIVVGGIAYEIGHAGVIESSIKGPDRAALERVGQTALIAMERALAEDDSRQFRALMTSRLKAIETPQHLTEVGNRIRSVDGKQVNAILY